MSPWLAVWTRAVIVPAWRRATGVWIGAAIGGGIVFGPTGMQPRDLTRLALGVPAVGAVLALTWLLVFLPTARVIVRADGAAYLRSLPGPRVAPVVIGALAVVAFQLPWLTLWVLGDGARGAAIVGALSLAIVLVAKLRLRVRPVRRPSWRSGAAALRGVYVRAVRRRAADALVRGAGIAVLAGLAAALIVRNNAATGRDAAVLGASTMAIVLVPALVGVLLPLVEATRTTAWLAASLGITQTTRIAVLAMVVVGIYVAGTMLAIAAAAIGLSAIFGVTSLATLAWFGAVALAAALGIALVATRSLVRAEADERGAAVRVVVGAIVGAAAAVVALVWLGVFGAGALIALGTSVLLTARVR